MTQYVYLNDTVTFECATNLAEYDFYFTIGGKFRQPTNFTSLTNGGRKVSLSEVATDQLNGTGVVCHSLNDGNVTETVYIYVQG